MKKKKAFSIMELIIAFVVVAVVVGTTTPILFKKAASIKLKGANPVSQTCSSINPECKLCYKKGNSQICLSCSKDCTADSYLDNAACSCTPCSTKFPKDNPVCDRCDAKYCKRCLKQQGYYLNKTSLIYPYRPCKGCEVNNYCPDGINKASCPTYSTTKGEIKRFRISQCICNEGYYRTVRAIDNCSECGMGYYCPDSTDEYSDETTPRRKQCGAGYYCPGKTDTKPTDCGIGYYCPGPIDSEHTKCPDNSTTATKNAKSIAECKCNAKYYRVTSGSTVICKPCEAGYRCPGDEKRYACTCGTYSGAGASACTTVNPGYYSTSSGGVYTGYAKCGAGNYCPNGCDRTPCKTEYYATTSETCSNLNCACKPCTEFGKTCTQCSSTVGCLDGYCGASKLRQIDLAKAQAGDGRYYCFRHPLSNSDCSSGYKYVNASGGLCFKQKNSIIKGTYTDNSSCRCAGSLCACFAAIRNKLYISDTLGSTSATYCDGGHCCWESEGVAGGDNTSEKGTCTNYETVNYTGCSRTLCTARSAEKVCSAEDSELPTKAEVQVAFNQYKSGNDLNFCLGNSNKDSKCSASDNACCSRKQTIYPFCNQRDNACFGSRADRCHPEYIFLASGNHVFFQRGSGRSGIYGCNCNSSGKSCSGANIGSTNISLKEADTNSGNSAGSIRCVKRWVRDF